ncbi:MAG: hypothetical protein KME48_19280 [Candidatus Thiodiazotropha sp. (ex Ctena orbiculata)]|nr:hypothetical protein [Candidatus Thiodiazotropha taylori]MBT3037031.1 hypothetical protein [Candidatus Thiodiazotropha taylori]
MEINAWIPSITTSSILLLLLWLGRKLIITRLTNSVKHEYDVKLEKLRDDLNKNSTQMRSLSSGALSGIINRQNAQYQRQVLAVDQIWNSVIQMKPAKVFAAQLGAYKFDTMMKAFTENPHLKEVIDVIGDDFDRNCLNGIDAEKSRPFISDLAWAYYSAYNLILRNYHVKYLMLQKGIDKTEIIENPNIIKVLVAALPHREEAIQTHGHEIFHTYLEELETLLLNELKSILQGSRASEESIKHAAKILQHVEDLQLKSPHT